MNEDLIQRKQADRVLISMGLDQTMIEILTRFSAFHPDAVILLILRRPESWIASQYRRYLKNGGYRTFSQFIDMDQDNGLWKQEDMNFYQRILDIEALFQKPPVILFHEDMKRDPLGFVGLLARVVQTDVELSTISIEPYHQSYSTQQLKVMRKIGGWLFRGQETPRSYRNPVIQWITRRSRLLTSYLFMWIARWLPSSFFNPEPLIPETELDEIRKRFADNWTKCQEYPGVIRL